ncbi:hypothetical protein [Amycolatopsis tolypomycina]|uniref:Uncharacterized protein n=1 Tax=Amycolatopsis tolypomycina TaxID=208445 RepID=A0A1H4SE94_9PSEU|nr:hypothetical protein [Amycolatopsis tolypomycina]SEC42459.1 hypothetical protein SAMN04489727_3702 [Amycolatopsis tolypomycina]
MGRGPRFWFPLALLGFAEIGLAAVQLLARRSQAQAEAANLLLRPAVPPGTTEYSRALWLPLDDFHTTGNPLPSGPAWLVALGLLVLAAYERSRFILVTTAAFALVAVVLSADMAGMLASAIILLAAAFVALLRQKPRIP